MFRLAWGVAGGHREPHPKFPYADSAEARQEFAEDFMVSERNLSVEQRAAQNGKSMPRQKLKSYNSGCLLGSSRVIPNRTSINQPRMDGKNTLLVAGTKTSLPRPFRSSEDRTYTSIEHPFVSAASAFHDTLFQSWPALPLSLTTIQ